MKQNEKKDKKKILLLQPMTTDINRAKKVIQKFRNNKLNGHGGIQAELMKSDVIYRNYLNLLRNYVTDVLMVRKSQRNGSSDI